MELERQSQIARARELEQDTAGAGELELERDGSSGIQRKRRRMLPELCGDIGLARCR